MSFNLFCLHPASTRKLYEKKLQKLLDQPPAEPDAPTDVTTLPKADSNQNGNTNSDQYSDKEDGEMNTHYQWSFTRLQKKNNRNISLHLKTCFLFSKQNYPVW